MRKFLWLWILIGVFVLFGIIGIVTKGDSLGKSVALIEIQGTISSSTQIIEDIEKCEKNSNIRGVVLHIDSPGGAVVPSQEIYNALKSLEKPTVAYLGSLAASGGYYIACGCDKIVSNQGTITGSIGVIMSFPNVTGLIKKIGVKFNVVKSREHKDIGSPYRKLTLEEHKLLKSVVDDVYDQFVNVVVDARGLSLEDVLKVADGRILSGRQAFNLGLVDTLGTLEDAKLIAGSLAGIEGKPKVIKLKRRITPWWLKLIRDYESGQVRLEYRWNNGVME